MNFRYQILNNHYLNNNNKKIKKKTEYKQRIKSLITQYVNQDLKIYHLDQEIGNMIILIITKIIFIISVNNKQNSQII